MQTVSCSVGIAEDLNNLIFINQILQTQLILGIVGLEDFPN